MSNYTIENPLVLKNNTLFSEKPTDYSGQYVSLEYAQGLQETVAALKDKSKTYEEDLSSKETECSLLKINVSELIEDTNELQQEKKELLKALKKCTLIINEIKEGDFYNEEFEVVNTHKEAKQLIAKIETK